MRARSRWLGGWALAAVLALGGCGPGLEPASRPALRAIPANCQPVLWTLTEECHRLSYHRCSGGAADQIYIHDTSPDGTVVILDQRNHGLLPAAAAAPGMAWAVTDPVAPGDPDALLAGRSTTVAGRDPLPETGVGSFRLRFAPSGEAAQINGRTLPRFAGQGHSFHREFGSQAMTGELYYAAEAGIFIRGRFVYDGPVGFVTDSTPRMISQTGPISAACGVL